MPNADKHPACYATAGRLRQCSSVAEVPCHWLYRCHNYILYPHWADVKSEGFCRLGASNEQLFCITSTSAPDETVQSQRYLRTLQWCDMVLLKCNNHLVINFASVACHYHYQTSIDVLTTESIL